MARDRCYESAELAKELALASGLVQRALTAVKVDIVIVGAGQAGLSSAYHLRKIGLEADNDFVTFDHSPRPGGAWQFRWPS